MTNKAKAQHGAKAQRKANARQYKAAARQILNNLCTLIDPIDQKRDSVTFSNDSLKGILEDFQKFFKIGSYATRKENIKAVWTYFLLSNHIIHWNGENDDMSKKAKMILEFENNNLAYISRALKKIEQCFETPKTVTPKGNSTNINIGDHQRFLMIQGYLKTFIRRQLGNTDVSKRTPEDILWHIPVNFPENAHNEATVHQRPNQSQKSNSVESLINKSISKNANNFPDMFRPIKNSATDFYIEQTTGLELDYPLMSKISIETDGTSYHQCHDTGRHDMVHTLKSTILRENDWVRVAVIPEFSNKKNEIMLDRLTRLLKTPIISSFHMEYQKLLALRQDVRKKLNIFQRNHMFDTGKKLNDIEKQYLNELLMFEKNISNFIDERHLESLLCESPFLYDKTKKNIDLEKKELLIEQSKKLDILFREKENLRKNHDKISSQYEKTKIITQANIEKLKPAEQKLEDIQKQIQEIDIQIANSLKNWETSSSKRRKGKKATKNQPLENNISPDLTNKKIELTTQYDELIKQDAKNQDEIAHLEKFLQKEKEALINSEQQLIDKTNLYNGRWQMLINNFSIYLPMARIKSLVNLATHKKEMIEKLYTQCPPPGAAEALPTSTNYASSQYSSIIQKAETGDMTPVAQLILDNLAPAVTLTPIQKRRVLQGKPAEQKVESLPTIEGTVWKKPLAFNKR